MGDVMISNFGVFALGFSLIGLLLVIYILYKSELLVSIRKAETELLREYKKYRNRNKINNRKEI